MTFQNYIIFIPIADDIFNDDNYKLAKNVKIILKVFLFFHLNNIIFFKE